MATIQLVPSRFTQGSGWGLLHYKHPMDLDARVRVAAFNFLAEQTRLLGEVLPRTLLAQGLSFEGKQVRLLDPQGIFKPPSCPSCR